MIYANTKTTIEKIVKNIITNSPCNEKLLSKYATWIKTNYSKNWFLYNGLLNGICVHYGKLHRHITQMNVKLYNDGITQTMICTSSLIEGVNTSSENLIMFNNILGNGNNKKDLDFFTYKNIIGRSGRAFRYFIGNCYLLAKEPQKDNSENLEIKPSKDDYLTIDDELDYTEKIINEAKKAEDDILNIISKKFVDKKQSIQKQRKILRLLKDGKLKTNVDNIIKVIEILCSDGFKESSLEYLNNDNPEKWGAFATFQKIYQIHERISKDKLTKYYQCKDNSIEHILENMQWKNIAELFEFENKVSIKLANLFSDVNELQKIIFDNKNIDISKKMVQRMYNLFMPSKILQLEEYGLPRMITKKLIGILPNIKNEEISIITLLEEFKKLGPNKIINHLKENNKFCDFDDEFIKYFFEGIS